MPSRRLSRSNTSDNIEVHKMGDDKPESFEYAGTKKQHGIVGEFIYFLKHNKKFWLVPILLVLLGMSVLVILGGTAAAPFIYTMF